MLYIYFRSMMASEDPLNRYEDAMHRCITKFMLDTYRCPKKENATAGHIIQFSWSVCLRPSFDDIEFFNSGSSAEFYIQPMLPCIGDIDIMQFSQRNLAMPCGRTPPMELSDCYKDTVTVYETIDSHQPGYVYLKTSYVLSKNDKGLYAVQKLVNSKKCGSFLSNTSNIFPETFKHDYVKRSCSQELCNDLNLLSVLIPAVDVHGPARTISTITIPTSPVAISRIDHVPCVHCPIWPPQADDWPVRNRHHGWPDQPTTSMVVRNACDVVAAIHPRCRQDEWMNAYQWRLSFSRAEITLINSWIPVQQIIYHMLRFVLKREVFAESSRKYPDVPKLSNYYIKTLMLWECEQNAPSWWWAQRSLVKTCSWLLYKLSDWIEDECYPHYFINDCNLFDQLVDNGTQHISNILRHFADENVLLVWFNDHYLRKCAQSCPREVSVLFEDISSCDKLEKAVDAIIDWKLSTLPRERYTDYSVPEENINCFLQVYREDALGVQMFMKELQYCHPQLQEYYAALTCLRVASRISTRSLTIDLLEVLWAVLNPSTRVTDDTSVTGLESVTLWCVRKAVKLAATTRGNSLAMVYTEMSKAYLHHAMSCEEDHPDCLVYVLLATLYYKSGQHQRAVDYCKQVVGQCHRQHRRLCLVTAETRPQIDDTVDIVPGLILLYHHLHRKAVKAGEELSRADNELAFSAALLAQYLYSKCSSVAEANDNPMVKPRRHLPCLLSDVVLFKVTGTQLQTTGPTVGTIKNASSSMDTSLLVTMLETLALERLIAFRQVMVRELHSDQFPIVNEFELLYMYKCGLYEDCLDLCRNHVNMILRVGCSRDQFFPIASHIPLCLFDGELLSLFGTIRLSYPRQALLFLEFPADISILTLLIYLMFQCQKKLRSDSLYVTLQLIRYVCDRVFSDDNYNFFDRLIFKLTYRSLKLLIDDLCY